MPRKYSLAAKKQSVLVCRVSHPVREAMKGPPQELLQPMSEKKPKSGGDAHPRVKERVVLLFIQEIIYLK